MNEISFWNGYPVLGDVKELDSITESMVVLIKKTLLMSYIPMEIILSQPVSTTISMRP